jgi:GR25 family glycosyltransferase involved in LPS biosynthesis
MHLLNKIFDHIYLINLKRRPDRLKIMNHRLEKEGIQYEVFYGVDGYDRRYDPICKKILAKEAANPKAFWIKSRGAVGIIMTYQKLLIDAQTKGYNSILILEDDITFHNDFENMLKKTKSVIDWNQIDAIWLGANQYRFDEEQKKQLEDPNLLYYTVSRKKWHYTFGAYALGLSKKIIPLFRKSLDLEKLIFAIDVEIFWVLANNGLWGRVLKPFLVLPDVTDSDNMGQRPQEEFAAERRYNLNDYHYLSLSKISDLKSWLNMNRISLRHLCMDVSYDLVMSKEKLLSQLENAEPLSHLLDYISPTDTFLVNELFLHVEERSSFVFVIPSYNNADNYQVNLNAIRRQIYPESQIRIIYIDDRSEDGTGQLVRDYIKKHEMENQTLIITPSKRQRQGLGRFISYHLAFDDEKLLMYDGDDWLADEYVVDNIDTHYNNKNLLVSFGGYIVYAPANKHQGKDMGIVYSKLLGCRDFPEEVVQKKTFRHYDWISCHLRNGVAQLFKNIEIKHLLGPDGYFLRMASDVSEMIPVLEQAQNRQANIKIPTYVYNKDNSLNFETSYYNRDQEGNEDNKTYREDVLTMIKKRPYYPKAVWNGKLEPTILKIEYMDDITLEKLHLSNAEWILYRTEWKDYFRYIRAAPFAITVDEEDGEEALIPGVFGQPELLVKKNTEKDIVPGIYNRKKLIAHLKHELVDVVLVPKLTEYAT